LSSPVARFRAQLAEGESSDRTFGFVLGGVLVLTQLLRYYRKANVQHWVAELAGLLILLAAVWPGLLRVPKRMWLFLGFLLGCVVNPIVLAVLFFAVLTPVGRLMKLF